MRRVLGFAVWGLGLGLVGCSARPAGGGGGGDAPGDMNFPMAVGEDGGAAPEEPGDGGPVVPPVNGAACNKMDILFVVDDSASMELEQANLAANFPKFIEVLEGYKAENGEPLDYRLGITTTGVSITYIIPGIFGSSQQPYVGRDGSLVENASCGMSDLFVSSTDADPGTVFSCAAEVGIDDEQAAEMPFRAVELAIKDRVADGTNAGFLREDALLGVVFLTDEDDCSKQGTTIESGLSGWDCTSGLRPADYLVGVLDEVTGDRSRWAAAVIAGPAGFTPCSSSFGQAAPGNRLQSFVDAAGENAVFSSVCEGDLSIGLLDAVNTFNVACENFGLL